MGNKSSRSNSNVPPDLAAATVSQSSNPSSSGVDVWYRHSGEAEVDRIPQDHKLRVQNYEEITRSVGSHYITHMSITVLGNELPPLDTIAPHLTHLKLKGVITQTNNLDRMKTLQQLQVLDLSDNQFYTGLPKVVSKLVSLRELKLSNCGLRDLPNSLETLQQLQVLDLSLSNFSTGLPKVVSKLVSLRELKLNYCDLTGLPNSLKTLQQLQVLNLSRNDFSGGLPIVVSELISLRELKLNNCHLTDLPKSMKTLQQLQVLDLSDNQFYTGLPKVVSKLVSLRELKLNYCDLTGLPNSMKALQQLQVFNISNNYFSEGLPEVVSQLVSLRELNQKECNLTDLPKSMKALKQLHVLDIRENHFSGGLPEVLFQLVSLRELNLGACELADLPLSDPVQRVWSVRQHIEQFLSEIGGDAAERFLEILRSEHSLRDMAFLTDILAHLNDLNLKLQGEGRNVVELWQAVTSFKDKLHCFYEDINSDMNHFPILREFVNDHDDVVDLTAARSFLIDVSSEMERRFAAFDSINDIIELVACPFQAQQFWNAQVDNFPHVQIGVTELELCDLKADLLAKAQFAEQTIVGF